MKRTLLLLLVLLPLWAFGQNPLPSKPANRVSDPSNIFDSAAAAEMSKSLKALYARSQISGYVVAMEQLDKKQDAIAPNQIRNAWITDKTGFIILYARNSDQISVSMTKAAFAIAQANGPLEEMAKKIDDFNLDGPSRGMPRVLDLVLDQLGAKRPPPVIIHSEKQLSTNLILIPLGVVLLLFGWGLFFLWRYLAGQNIFHTRYQFRTKKVSPVLGSTIGGVNTAIRKY